MASDYKQMMKDVSSQVSVLKKDQPDTISGFYAMAGGATKNGALDEKTKELITLAIAVALRCEPCMAFHTASLVRLGVTKEELEETTRLRHLYGRRPCSDVCGSCHGSI